MDPASAFSLAGTVLQFLDTGSKFVGLAWRLYASGPNGTTDGSELRGITASLKEALEDLASPCSTHQLKGQNDGIHELAKDCSKVASKLLQVLQQVEVPKNPRKRDAAKTAFRLLVKQDEIKSLQSTLDSIRAEFSLQLLLSLRRHAARSAEQQAETLDRIGVVENGLSKQKDIASSVLEYIVSKADISNRTQQLNSLRHGLISSIYSGEQSLEQNATNIQIIPSQKELVQNYVLESLQYSGMAERNSRIADAHKATFQWALHDQEEPGKKWSNLSRWLPGVDQLYWITGKAGSGKSTLMKYLCEPIEEIDSKTYPEGFSLASPFRSKSRCHPFLGKWAGELDLVVASFYFWNSGTQLQMSQEGLLLSLLSQIFSQRPDIIHISAPKRWESLCLLGYSPEKWAMQELRKTLVLAVKSLAQDAKLCLFVDGLDEFEGDHNALVSLIKEIIQLHDYVKICVASRPWVVFQDAFRHGPNLRLEDLTYNDVKLFVTSKLTDDPEFSKLQRREREFADDLIENIVSKASGVFLWVHLVVASLLAGMSFGDRVLDLQKRLDVLPPDLEDLYDKMLQSLDPFYLEHAAQYFTLLEVAEQPLTIIQFAFADEESPDSAIKISVGPMAEQDQHLHIEAMARRLNSRCKGLLEIERGQRDALGSDMVPRPNATVQYLHRTVKDFIQSSKAQKFLQSSITADFDPHLSLCIAFLAYTKTLDQLPAKLVYVDTLRPCLRNASRVLPKNEKAVIRLLDDLSATLDKFCERQTCSAQTDPFESTHQQPGVIHQVDKFRRKKCLEDLLDDAWGYDADWAYIGRHFLSLVIVNGVQSYVRAKAPHKGLIQFQSITNPNTEVEWPLLCDALCSTTPDCEMVGCILAMGADPNFLIPERVGTMGYSSRNTPWRLALAIAEPLWDVIGDRQAHPLKSLLDLMIAYGADTSFLPKKMRSHYSRKRVKELGRTVENTTAKTMNRKSWLSWRR